MRLIRLSRSADAPPDALPHRLTRKRIFILPTAHGVLFLVVLAAMLVGSTNYNNNMGFLLTFLLGAMTFVSILHTHRNLAGVEVVSVSPRPAFVGEHALFRVRLRNPSHRRSMLVFYFTLDHVKAVATLDAEAEADVLHPTQRRGLLRPRYLVIETRFPLGLFRAWSRLHLSATCPVYPKPIFGTSLPGEKAGTTDADTDEADERAGADDFKELKSYQPGDPLHHISWKAFSKGQGLLVKSFVGNTGDAVRIDYDALSDTDTERRLSKLCGMVIRAHERDLRYGLTLPGTDIQPDLSEQHKHRCLKALALFGKGGDAA